MSIGIIKRVSRITDFFRRPLDAAFAKTADGHDVFYLWPWQHPGYVLPSAEATQKLRSTMYMWVRMALPAFILYAVLGVTVLVSFGSMYIVFYYGTLWLQARRFAVATKDGEELLSLREHETA